MEKVSLRKVYLEIGRKCNLKCRHCCKGESQNVAMSDEVMDALLDNVYFIDELVISGGEPILYTERLETLLRKCKEKKIKVNYVVVISNCTIKSEKFVRVFNEWSEYTTFRNNKLSISNDIFHEEYVKEHLSSVNLEENINWYEERLKYCGVEKADDEYLNLKIQIVDEGNVNLWTQEEKDKFLRVQKLIQEKNAICKVPIREICQGEENLCGYECVKNCIFRTPYINVYGNMLLESFTSFKKQDNPESEMVMGNILEKDIYTIVKEWNESIDENKDAFQFEIEKDDFWEGLSDRMTMIMLKAEQFCRAGKFKKAEEGLQKIDGYYKVYSNERNKILEAKDKEFEKNLEKWGSTSQYMKYLKKNNPHEYEQMQILALLTSDLVNNLGEELEKSKNILKERAELNMPGSIFEKPTQKKNINLWELLRNCK